MMTQKSMPWYAIHTKPRRELMVASLLAEYADVNIFLPEVLHHRRHGMQKLPLFPGYLFARFDIETGIAALISHTPGVIGLISSNHQPIPVANETIVYLKHKVEEVNEQGGLPIHQLLCGDSVLITDGPLQGLEALFVGPLGAAQRVRVLLHFLGQQQAVEVEVWKLEKVSSVHKVRKIFLQSMRQPRRTRGYGRKIHLKL